MPRIAQFVREHQRWLIVALLFFVALVNNLDRQTLSVLAPTLRKEMGFGPIEYSYITSAFLAAYTLGYLFCGRVLDHLGVKLGLALALAFWSIAGAGHAMAVGWMSLAAFRFLLGLGESFNSPAGVKAIAEWIPPRERGLCMAVFSNGNVIGAIIAPPLVSFLALHLSWPWAFLVTGASGLVLLVIWWRVYETPESHPRLTSAERDYILAARTPPGLAPAAKLPMWRLMANPICVGFFVARLLTDSTSYFFSFWLPDYLTHARGFTLAMIGLVGWLPFLASDLGGPGGGALSDWMIRRGWNPGRARRTLMLLAACLMPLAAVAVRVDSAWVAIALIAVLLAAQSCWMANQLTLISESVSRENVATLLALSAVGGSLGGIASNLLTGRAVAAYGYVPVFTALGALHLTAFAALVWGFRVEARQAARR
ncbi:MAG: MFS transporter [Verrucomicrobiota bacterium]|jgi:ACS family hexuronate transporter-like MFS transporter